MEGYLTEERLIKFIDNALAEDIGPGDYSSQASVSDEKEGKAQLLIKADGIIAGVELAQRIFHRFDPALKIEVYLTFYTFLNIWLIKR